jgi:hypothetical protein
VKTLLIDNDDSFIFQPLQRSCGLGDLWRRIPQFEPSTTDVGHYWPFVPESPHIRVYIRAYPARIRLAK